MARRARMGVKLFTDFTSVAKFIGAGEAMAESVSGNSAYIDDVVRAAYKEVEHEFNVEAAAAAAAGTNIKHMFEWGTQGINRRKSNVRPNPLSERARLWHTVITGHGLNQTLTYVFKPSVAIVPKPTTGETGMDPEVINSLSDHVFWNKAEVLETGASVTIQPVDAQFLLIPYYNSQQGNIMFSENDMDRGFTLSKGPHTHSPGDTAGTTGVFTGFWTGWWEGTGEKLMEGSVTEQIESDFFPAITVAYSPNSPSPAVPGEFVEQVSKQKSVVKKQATAKARARRKTR